MYSCARLVLPLILLSACAPDERAVLDDGGAGDDATGAVDGGGFVDATLAQDGGGQAGESVIFAHTGPTLFRIDADTLELSEVGDFQWPAGINGDAITDIAIDGDGKITAVSNTRVYSVDSSTAAATLLSTLEAGHQFNALSWLPAGTIPGTSGEVLIGAAGDGSFWRIDPSTGAATLQGTYGNGYKSSGDLVSIEGAGTFATVKDGTMERLVRLDPVTGATTPVGGPLAFTKIFGLAYWKGQLYGFTAGGALVVIDPTSGGSSLQQMTPGMVWYGAGVTTQAPIVE